MYARIAYIPVNRGAVKLTKDKYIFELIDQCMLITCQNNILVENFELRDDKMCIRDRDSTLPTTGIKVTLE